jgi:hypothetical protein
MAVANNTATSIQASGEGWLVDSIAQADQTVRSIAGAIGAGSPVTHAVVVDRPARALCAVPSPETLPSRRSCSLLIVHTNGARS